jgi:dTDP-4-dehydrorhamnose reductase
MTILILGAGGLLGSNVATLAAAQGDVVGTYHTSEPDLGVRTRQLAIEDAELVKETLDDVAPTAVINCAAMTDVDGCESAPEQANEVNARAPGRIAQLCSDRGIDLVHVSTDYVFDGESKDRYTETSATNPIQEYGASKLEGEQAVRESDADAALVRLSFVYGVHQATGELTGFPAWVAGRLEAGEEVPLFTDQHVTPSRAGQSASVLLSLLEQGATGCYHAACRSCVTPYEFGHEIRQRMGAPEELMTTSRMADVERPARRPANTCLDVSRLEETLGESQPTLEEDLDSIAAAWG